MKAHDYWQMFMETGAPEAYLLYTNAVKMEAADVSERAGAGAAGHGLQ